MNMAYHLGYAHSQCLYAHHQIPSYIDCLDLSDILEFEEYMVTSSDKDIPALEDMPY